MSILKFIISTSWKFKKAIIGMFICTFITAIDSNARPYIIKLLIDQSSNFNLNTFILLSSIYISSQILMIASNSMFDWFGSLYHTHYRPSIAQFFFNKVTKYSYRFFQETQAGSITTGISDAFNVIPVIVFTIIRWFIHFFLFALISIIILSKISYFFAFAAIVWVIIFLSLTAIFFKKVTPINTDFSTVRPRIYGFLADYISNILSVWCFSNVKHEKEKFYKITSQYTIKGLFFGKFLRNFYFLHGLTVAIYMAFILVLLGYLSTKGTITAGDFALVFMVNYKIVDMLFEISNLSREFVTNLGIVRQSLKILDFPLEIQDIHNAPNLKVISGEIEFDKVQFHYKGSETIFHNKSVIIGPGQKVGLVGYSGCGKSTFVNLILRLYDISEGRILIDGQDIREVTQDSLRNNIGIIPQDPSLFHRTIIENIRYGRLQATDEEVYEASKQANAHEFIIKLPQGYKTLVGERGVKLSGGQRQRIAIARVILKNAPILILDEATSQLDSITESGIQESLWKLMQEKTTIVIAHRLSTLLNMDHILVFEKGMIVEDGTHKELLAKNGLYKTLWEAQVGGFLPPKASYY
jgi:ATP-binding cassette subfamily B protein